MRPTQPTLARRPAPPVLPARTPCTAGVRVAVAAAMVAVASGVGAATPPGKPPVQADNSAYEASLRHELDGLREQFEASKSPGDLTPALDQLFDRTIAYAIPSSDEPLLRDVNSLRRMVRQLGQLKPDDAMPTKALLAENPALARAVSGSIGPFDNVPGAYAVLRLLAEKFPDRVLDAKDSPAGGKPRRKPGEDLTNLVAAFCIVYDGPLPPEGQAGAVEAPPIDAQRVEAVFDFFSTNASRMTFGPGTSPELLAYVVSPDPRVTIDDLNWALKGYAGNKTVGKLYKTIVYDTAHFKHGAPKKVEKAPGGVTLQNIRKFGGVCAEQALFAANVGKAIGVPAVVVTGRGSDVSHAWVGYLKSAGSGRYEWDFDEGRFDEYKDVRGNVRDPRTGTIVPDGYIGLTAGLLAHAGPASRSDAAVAASREQSTAMFDAAQRLAAVEGARLAYPPPMAPGSPAPTSTLRPLGVESQIGLIELGLRQQPANRRGWEMITSMAAARRLPAAQIKPWAERVLELCGSEHPDFAFDALAPLIASVSDTTEQDRLWEWAIGRFNSRKDLAAAAILARGDFWDRSKDPRKAWEQYNTVIERYANDGAVIMDALSRAEKLLGKEAKTDQLAPLYQGAWGRITKPKTAASEFTRASTYVLVGRRLAELLDGAGKPLDAKKVRDAIKDVLEK